MSNKKATKRALLTSITALAMCVVMLVGTTFAWFTDTATANVNKIQAGKLDVDIVDTNDNSLDGKTLKFVKMDATTGKATASDDILWEPGASFALQTFKIVNKGDLSLKYKIVISGATGDTMLLDVIDFSAKIDGTTYPRVSVKDNTPVVMDQMLLPKASVTVDLVGTMQTSANNDYMNKTVTGISIAVYAAQATGEYDSSTNEYDKDAAYPTLAPVLNVTTSADVTLTNNALPATTINEGGAVSTVTAGTTMSDENSNAVEAANGKLERVISTTAKSNPDGTDTTTYDISYKFVDGNGTSTSVAKFSNVVTNTIQLSAGLTNVKVTHTHGSTTTDMTAATDTAHQGEDGYFYYSEATGVLTIWSSKYSKFAVSYDANFVAAINGQGYASLAAAIDAAKDGDTITLLKSTNGNGIALDTGKFATEGLTVDFNGHTYTVGGLLVGSAGTGTNAFQLLQGGKITFKNGSIVGVTEGTKPAEDTPDWHGAPAMMIQNYCDLTLDNMTVTGGDETVYTVSNNNGNVVIKDTTINKGGAKGYGYGPYAFDVCRFSPYPSVDVTVTGNSVINGDVEVSGKIGDGQSRQLTINSGKFYGKFKVVDEPANITINGGEFVDLANAVKYVTDGATIKLAEDTQGSGVKVESGKNFTIDLNGYTYTVAQPLVGSTGTETNAFQFLMNSNITIKNGKMGAGDSLRCAYYFQNYANLTLQDVEVTIDNCRACEAVVHSMNGVVKVIGNTTINASGDYFWNVTDKGVRKAIMVMDWNNNSYSNGTQVTVNTTGTINGMVHAGYYNVSDKGATSGKSALVLENGIFNGVLSQEATSGGYEATPFTIVGGTFNTDPTAFVDTTTHTVSNDGSVWTVTKAA